VYAANLAYTLVTHRDVFAFAHHGVDEAARRVTRCKYALENLLKAVRVKQLRAVGEPIFVNDRLRTELTRHGLVALAKAASVPLARHERFLLERLTVTINWGGRYQAPKEVGETDVASMISTDRETIRIFAAKLEAILDGQAAWSYDDASS